MKGRGLSIQITDLVVGLGRPKCGVLINGVHAELASESPITCGLSAEKTNIVWACGWDNNLTGRQNGLQRIAIDRIDIIYKKRLCF